MLGVRLKPEDEELLAKHARALGRTKSSLVRDWIKERLERESDDAKLRRAVEIINATTTAEEYEWHAARAAETFRALEAEDGGYDWGPQGAPS